MMCWASDNEEHRGFLELPTGHPMTDLDIAHRVGKPIKEVRAAIEAMRRLGTFSEDARGCIFSRRMARDTHISEVRRQAAEKRARTISRAADGSFSSPLTSPGENPKPPRSEVAPQWLTKPNSPLESSKDINFGGAKPPAKPEQNPTVTASASVSVPVSVLTHTQSSARAPVAADLNGHTSQRFDEFWQKWPRKTGKDAAASAWISYVSINVEGKVFACLERFLASGDMERGAIPNAGPSAGKPGWLADCHRDQWESDWPRVVQQERKRPMTALEKAQEMMRNGTGPAAKSR